VWECRKCHEQVEDSFAVCWKCGTSNEGVEDPSFRNADDVDAALEGPPIGERKDEVSATPADLDGQLAGRFRCPKCQNRGGSVKRFAATGTGLSRLFDVQHNEFIAVSCTRCSFTELYNPQILEGKGVAMSVLDLLFGG
jgi:predicted nucleic-acid-binding Zn-ribbon protein